MWLLAAKYYFTPHDDNVIAASSRTLGHIKSFGIMFNESQLSVPFEASIVAIINN